MARLSGWILRILAWSALLLPLARWACIPWRVWFEGRHAQMYLAAQRKCAADSILEGYGLLKRYSDYRCELQAYDSFWSVVNFTTIDRFHISLSDNVWGFLRARGTVFLDRNGHALLPPFWSANVVARFELQGADERRYCAVLVPRNNDMGWAYEMRSECRVWVLEHQQWVCKLRIEPDERLGTRIEFEPPTELPRSILCYRRELSEDSDREVLTAKFTWDPYDRMFVTEFAQEPVRRIVEVLAPTTFEPLWYSDLAAPDVILDIEELDAESD